MLLVLSTKMTNPHLAKADQAGTLGTAWKQIDVSHASRLQRSALCELLRIPTVMNRRRRASGPPYDSIAISEVSSIVSQRDSNVQVVCRILFHHAHSCNRSLLSMGEIEDRKALASLW
jgi:hypothetical protein